MKDITLLTADQGSEPVSASERVHSFQQPKHWATLTQQSRRESSLAGLLQASGYTYCHSPSTYISRQSSDI